MRLPHNSMSLPLAKYFSQLGSRSLQSISMTKRTVGFSSRIVEINTDSGYAVVEAGINFDKLTTALREKGFRCSIPTAPGGSAVVGNYLSRPTGSLCNRHLDLIVDLEVVLPDGTVFNTGSSQFPHAGSHMRYGPHPDLAGLFTCAYGTMGVVTKAFLK